jgi:hypothetical protein
MILLGQRHVAQPCVFPKSNTWSIPGHKSASIKEILFDSCYDFSEQRLSGFCLHVRKSFISAKYPVAASSYHKPFPFRNFNIHLLSKHMFWYPTYWRTWYPKNFIYHARNSQGWLSRCRKHSHTIDDHDQTMEMKMLLMPTPTARLYLPGLGL